MDEVFSSVDVGTLSALPPLDSADVKLPQYLPFISSKRFISSLTIFSLDNVFSASMSDRRYVIFLSGSLGAKHLWDGPLLRAASSKIGLGLRAVP